MRMFAAFICTVFIAGCINLEPEPEIEVVPTTILTPVEPEEVLDEASKAPVVPSKPKFTSEEQWILGSEVKPLKACEEAKERDSEVNC